MEQTDVAGLVVAAQGGDNKAFDDLVRLTYADTYALAYRLTGNQEDAGDVTQEAYLRAFRGLHRFRGDAQFGTWMFRITSNCAATHHGRRRRHLHAELDDDCAIEESPVASPELRAEAGDLRRRLDAAISRLPAKLRAVVVLRDVYDLSHEDIATELEISETAAKVRLHRARRRLRTDLFGDGTSADGIGADGMGADGMQEAARAV